MIPIHDWLILRQAGPPVIIPGFESDEPPTVELEVPLDIEALIAEASRKGREEAEEDVAQRITLLLAEQARKHEEELDALRQSANTRELELIREALSQCMADLHEQLARDVAAVLKSFLEPAIEREALKAFRAALAELAGAESLVRLEGPERLITALTAMGPLPAGIATGVGDSISLRAISGDTVAELRLRKWIEAIQDGNP